jgi:hypothetical protein
MQHYKITFRGGGEVTKNKDITQKIIYYYITEQTLHTQLRKYIEQYQVNASRKVGVPK